MKEAVGNPRFIARQLHCWESLSRQWLQTHEWTLHRSFPGNLSCRFTCLRMHRTTVTLTTATSLQVLDGIQKAKSRWSQHR